MSSNYNVILKGKTLPLSLLNDHQKVCLLSQVLYPIWHENIARAICSITCNFDIQHLHFVYKGIVNKLWKKIVVSLSLVIKNYALIGLWWESWIINDFILCYFCLFLAFEYSKQEFTFLIESLSRMRLDQRSKGSAQIFSQQIMNH